MKNNECESRKTNEIVGCVQRSFQYDRHQVHFEQFWDRWYMFTMYTPHVANYYLLNTMFREKYGPFLNHI